MLVADGDGAALLDVTAAPCQEQSALDPEHPQLWFTLQGAPVLARLDAAAWAACAKASRTAAATSRQLASLPLRE